MFSSRRGLKVRKQETKRMSAQIIGSICSFIMDVSDIEPYAVYLIDGIKDILVDPIPEVCFMLHLQRTAISILVLHLATRTH